MSRHVTDVLICTSPKAGSGRGREQIPLLEQRLKAAGVKVQQTDSIHTIRTRLQSDLPPVLVPAGGDGTISLVADLVSPENPIVPMPLGTENLLARHFGYVCDAKRVAETILLGRDTHIDAGRANGKLFLVMASCGFDAEVVRGVHLRRSGHINRFTYARPILRAINRYGFPKLRIRVDGQDVTGENPVCWAMVFNLPSYGGGLSIEPGAIGNDGLLDLITFKRGGLCSGLRYVVGIWTGTHLNFSDCIRQKGKHIQIEADQRVPYQLDGDYVGRLPLSIETLTDRLCLRLPHDTELPKIPE